jgi:putative transcription factor
MDCEVCGSQIIGRAYSVVIEGAKLLVCSECSNSNSSPTRYEPKILKVSPKKVTPVRPVRPVRPRMKTRASQQRFMLENSVIVKGYGKRIRQGREKLGFTHEELSRKIGEKISLLQKLETEKMTPELVLAKKLESNLKIKILESPTLAQVGEEVLTHKPTALTLGDVVVVQKRDEL